MPSLNNGRHEREGQIVPSSYRIVGLNTPICDRDFSLPSAVSTEFKTMAIQSLYGAEIATWKDIRQIATSLAERTKNAQQFPVSSPPPSNSSKPNLPLDLPFPHTILERILTSELPERTRQKLINSVTQRVNELRASLSVAGLHYDDVLHPAFQRLYQEKFIPIVDSRLQSLLAGSTQRQNNHHDRRPAFNTVSPLISSFSLTCT